MDLNEGLSSTQQSIPACPPNAHMSDQARAFSKSETTTVSSSPDVKYIARRIARDPVPRAAANPSDAFRRHRASHHVTSTRSNTVTLGLVPRNLLSGFLSSNLASNLSVLSARRATTFFQITQCKKARTKIFLSVERSTLIHWQMFLFKNHCVKNVSATLYVYVIDKKLVW